MKSMIRMAGMLTVVLAFFGSFMLASMILDRTAPIAYEGVRALAATVAPGGSLDVEFRVFRTRVCQASARRWVVDAAGARHAIPSYTVGVQQLAGRETYRRSITIPEAAAPGPAYYEVTIDYACNVIHQLGFPIRVRSPPVTFIIVAKEHPPP